MLKTLKSKKAEGYIDVAVAVLVIAFVIALVFSIWYSLFILSIRSCAMFSYGLATHTFDVATGVISTQVLWI